MTWKAHHTTALALGACLFIAGAANGLMDALQFHGAWQAFDCREFWHPGESWVRKWAANAEGGVIVGTERVWGSSRWFVALTDGWHLAKFVQLLFVKLAVLIVFVFPPSTWGLRGRTWGQAVLVLAGWFTWATLCMSAGFHLTYSYIF